MTGPDASFGRVRRDFFTSVTIDWGGKSAGSMLYPITSMVEDPLVSSQKMAWLDVMSAEQYSLAK